MDKGVRVGLHVGAFVFGITGAFYVCLGTVADQVIFLAVFNVVQQPFVVLCTAGLVTVIGDGKQGVHGVRAHAALHASAYPVAD